MVKYLRLRSSSSPPVIHRDVPFIDTLAVALFLIDILTKISTFLAVILQRMFNYKNFYNLGKFGQFWLNLDKLELIWTSLDQFEQI